LLIGQPYCGSFGGQPGLGRPPLLGLLRRPGPGLSLRSVGIFGLLGRARGIDFVAFFPPKMGFRRPNL
ncbi:MAG TPA: hypothetical protein VFT19_01180, partial [Solirubrobacterales bacterium]|nr:hypothetical protein [Solirubrobacterales bacterium]